MMTTTEPREITGRSVLIMMVSFFAVVFAVNIYFAVSAIKTYTGVVSVEPYRKGLNYNRRIAADERQTELGWKANVDLGREGSARLIIMGADDRPVGGLTIKATLGRPSTDTFDRSLAFVETAPGQYEATGAAIDAGSWIVDAEARQKNDTADPVFRMRKRIWLKP